MAGVELGGGGGGEVDTGAVVTGVVGVQTPRPASCSEFVGGHWSRHLKCHVCFSYLRQPHTLTCGHSFCKGCLVRLGQTAKAANSDIPLRYLHLPCPICRAIFPAAAILRRRAATSFLVQNLVADWKKERKRMQSSSTVTLRSICTQTSPNRNQAKQPHNKSPVPPTKQDLHEKFHVRTRYDDCYYRSLSAACSSESSEETDIKPVRPIIAFPDPSMNASDTSTVSSSSGDGAFFGRGLSVWRSHLARSEQQVDWSPGRVVLISVWCMYSLVVVGIAQPMLPYMVLITLFFLVLIFKE